MQHGVAPKLPQRNVELMVAELNAQRAKRGTYSRRQAQQSWDRHRTGRSCRSAVWSL